MKAELLCFDIRDFEEVYVIKDTENQRLHISLVNYKYNLTLDLTRDLNKQLVEQTSFGDKLFNDDVRKVVHRIIVGTTRATPTTLING